MQAAWTFPGSLLNSIVKLLALICLLSWSAQATEIIGVFNLFGTPEAVVSHDNRQISLSVGETKQGITLLQITENGAVVSENGVTNLLKIKNLSLTYNKPAPPAAPVHLSNSFQASREQLLQMGFVVPNDDE